MHIYTCIYRVLGSDVLEGLDGADELLGVEEAERQVRRGRHVPRLLQERHAYHVRLPRTQDLGAYSSPNFHSSEQDHVPRLLLSQEGSDERVTPARKPSHILRALA